MSERIDSRIKLERSRSRSPTMRPARSKVIIISNIPFTTTMNDLRNLFKQTIGICGKLEFIEKNGKFTGNAIMEFKSLDGAQRAINNLNKHEINGRQIVVREETEMDRKRLNLTDSYDKGLFPQTNTQNSLAQLVKDIESQGIITNTIFIYNLDYSVTWKNLKDMFRAIGVVRHADIMADDSGKSRGCGTVEFETPEAAILAIHTFNNTIVNNRPIRMRMDRSGKASTGRLNLSQLSTTNQELVSKNMNPQIKRLFEDLLIASNKPNQNSPHVKKALEELLMLAKMFEKPTTKEHIIVQNNYPIHQIKRSNIAYNDTCPNLHNYGAPKYGDDDKPIIYNDLNNTNEYPPALSRIVRHSDDSRNADYQNYSTYNNNTGEFNMAMFDDMLLKMKNSGNFDPNLLINSITNVMTQYPKSQQQKPPIKNIINQTNFYPGNSSSTVLIKNIPFSYTWQDLQISFSHISGIEHIEILHDDYNRSKGVAVVKFKSYPEAIHCQNVMDGSMLDGRPIHVEVTN